MHQTLLVIRNRHKQAIHTERLRDGAAGNVRTLQFVRQMVREDSAFNLDLRRLAQSLVAQCSPDDFDCEVLTLFEYAQQIRFVRDPIDVERVADAMTTSAEGQGDCVDKSILLASLLGSVGRLTRGKVVSFYGDVEAYGFDHFYLEVQRPDGAWQPLDPTPENVSPGWEAKALVRRTVEFWDGTGGRDNISGLLDQLLPSLIGQGVQLGSQLVAGSRQSGTAAAAEKQVGQAFDEAARQVTAFFDEVQRRSVITSADLDAVTQAYQELAAVAQQYASVEYVSRQWASPAYKAAYEARLHDIAARVQPQQAGGSESGNVTQSPPAAGTILNGLTSNPLFWPLVVLVAVLVLPGILRND